MAEEEPGGLRWAEAWPPPSPAGTVLRGRLGSGVRPLKVSKAAGDGVGRFTFLPGVGPVSSHAGLEFSPVSTQVCSSARP